MNARGSRRGSGGSRSTAWRNQLTEEQRNARREIDARRRREARQRLTAARREAIAEQNRVEHQETRRRNMSATLNIAKRNTIDDISREPIACSPYSCGGLVLHCRFCDALMFKEEKTSGTQIQPNFAICCNSGSIRIPQIREVPSNLQELFNGVTPISKYFLKNSRRFNSAMAMCSMKADDATLAGGVASYRVHGVVYRLLGPAQNSTQQEPTCLQTYFYDQDEQVNHRMNRMTGPNNNSNFDDAIFRILHASLIESGNSYLTSFLSIREQVASGSFPQNFEIGLHADKRPSGEHSRRYNLPTSNEVSILIPNENEGINRSRMIVTKFRTDGNSRQLQTFSDSHRSYDPMMYPTFFPEGLDGWHLQLENARGTRKVTCIQFYAYRIMKRAMASSILHRGNRLFQQYCVDMYAKAESCRLRYMRDHQSTLRAELYNGLADALVAGDAERTGRPVILPGELLWIYGSRIL